MSVTGKRGVGIPIILLHDAEGGTITVELKSGCIYRGILDEAQDNMNCTMKVFNGVQATSLAKYFIILSLNNLAIVFVGVYQNQSRGRGVSDRNSIHKGITDQLHCPT